MHDSPTVRPQQHFSSDSFSYRGSYLGTNFGGVHVGCHCWVFSAPLLGCYCWGAIAGVPLLGAIAGCHCWGAIAGCQLGAIAGCHAAVPLLGAIAGVPLLGCHCWVPLLGCHCWGAIAGCHCGVISMSNFWKDTNFFKLFCA